MSQFLYRNLNPDLISYRKACDIKYRSQVGLCIAEGFRKRGYTRSERSDQNWDIYWVQKECLEHFYANHRVLRQQRVNHYRSYFQICRKDNLNRNLKKHKRNLQRQGRIKQAAQYNFAPLTFHLPLEFSSLSEQFKRISGTGKPNIWIMKPPAKLQGKGIFLFNKLNSIQQWMQNPQAEAYICQKYIQNPLLIGHKKFDLRLYVLCTSYRPLTAYIYRQGFARFTHSRYDDSNISSTEIHLTNVAIQKHTSEYSKNLGGKWMISRLKKYLLTKYPIQVVNNCFNQIKNLAIKTLRSVSKIMSNQVNCFQLYGFDVMLDDTLKPWLIEVNGSPSMRANTKKDRQLKVGVIDDMLSIVDIEKILTGNQETLGGFDAICRKDVNFQFEYYAGMRVCMLGCKLDREKCYKTLANTLNNYYKQKKNPTSNSISQPSKAPQKQAISPQYNQYKKQAQSQAFSTPSQNRKSFSVRKQKQNSNLLKNPNNNYNTNNNEGKSQGILESDNGGIRGSVGYRDGQGFNQVYSAKDKYKNQYNDSQTDLKSEVSADESYKKSRAISLFGTNNNNQDNNAASSNLVFVKQYQTNSNNTNLLTNAKNVSANYNSNSSRVGNQKQSIISSSYSPNTAVVSPPSTNPFRKHSSNSTKNPTKAQQQGNNTQNTGQQMNHKKSDSIFASQNNYNYHNMHNVNINLNFGPGVGVGASSQDIRQRPMLRRNC